MSAEKELNIVREFANQVVNKYDCVEIVLFGSYVKGSYDVDSDIDIAVILKDYDNLLTIQLDLMRLRRKIDSRIEPHLLKNVILMMKILWQLK